MHVYVCEYWYKCIFPRFFLNSCIVVAIALQFQHPANAVLGGGRQWLKWQSPSTQRESQAEFHYRPWRSQQRSALSTSLPKKEVNRMWAALFAS